jgi:aerobic carbon-monoxide dehydrogenase medium subunit
MKPRGFEYSRPRSLSEAFALLEEYGEGASILAGGQSLMPTLNMRLSAPAILVDVNTIEGLSGIELEGDVLRIGAMTRHVEVERNQLVAQHAPLIAQAMPHIAHAAIRNRGTFGGSLAFADPAAELPACVVALAARLVLQSRTHRRTVDAEDFFRGLYSTALEPHEILVACEIPIAGPQSRHCFAELARRQGDYAIIGVAANLVMQDGRFSEARLVYFSAGDRPMLAGAAAEALADRPNSPQTRESAAEALGGDLDPPEDLNADSAMRLRLAKVLTRRVLERLHS